MLLFSPKTSRLWQAAAFSLIYSSILLVIVRLLIFVFLITTITLLLTSNVEKFPYFLFSLLGIFTMFELFYRFKLTKIQPIFDKDYIKAETNLANLVTFKLAKILLAHPNWGNTQEILKGLFPDPKIKFVLSKANIRHEELFSQLDKTEKIDINSLLQFAIDIGTKEDRIFIDELYLLNSLFVESDNLKNLLFEKQLKQNDLENIIHWARKYFPTEIEKTPFWKQSNSSIGLGLANLWLGGWTLETERFTKDINAEVLKQNHKFFLVGRNRELQQVEEVLARTVKRNAVLLGEPGIGKTTIVYSLAQNSTLGRLSAKLSYKRFLELDFTAINAGSTGGEIENRLKSILTEVSHADNVVLFIPEIENLAGALQDGKFDITGLLSQDLKTINLQIIGTSTRSAYHKFIEDKPTFADDFEIIDVSEPNVDETIRILEEASTLIEWRTKTFISYNAIRKAVELSERYLIDKVLPGKAIDLLDEAAAANSISGKDLLESADIESIVTAKFKVPTGLASTEEKEKLLKLEEILHQRIVSQDGAIKTVSQAVRRSRTLKQDSKKPIGVFLFLGPTGVGKTETAKALAEVYFGSEEKIIRLDMSEFNQENSVYRLIGAPPGVADYKEGGQLTEAVRQNPFSLILLDELEKANTKVLEIFLAIFDEGRITDSSGRPISFTNTIIVATSNAGSEFIRETIQKNLAKDLKKELIEKLLAEHTFKPEFLNRFDEIIVYEPLSEKEIEQVVGLMLQKLIRRLEKQDIQLNLSPEVIAFLARTGYDPTFGARPLQREIQDQVEAKVSEAILEGKLSRGMLAQVSLVNNQIVVT